jgi:hypothetical protein
VPPGWVWRFAAAVGTMTEMTPLRLVRRAPGVERPGVPQRRRDRVGLTLGVLLFLGAGAALIGWHPPAVFYEVNKTGVDVSGRAAAGDPVSYGMSYVRSTSRAGVTVDRVMPNVVENSARATVTVQVCTPDVRAGSGAIGSTRDAHRQCSRLVPAQGAVMHLAGPAPDQLLVTVTGMVPGVVRIEGLHVGYTHGWHRGTQDVGADLRLVVG